eukprot:scaffold59308_cov34-Phaeocystis_antarctica.AAC.4
MPLCRGACRWSGTVSIERNSTEDLATATLSNLTLRASDSSSSASCTAVRAFLCKPIVTRSVPTSPWCAIRLESPPGSLLKNPGERCPWRKNSSRTTAAWPVCERESSTTGAVGLILAARELADCTQAHPRAGRRCGQPGGSRPKRLNRRGSRGEDTSFSAPKEKLRISQVEASCSRHCSSSSFPSETQVSIVGESPRLTASE